MFTMYMSYKMTGWASGWTIKHVQAAAVCR